MKIIEGTFQYFYCTSSFGDLPHPDVPTRDVTNTRGQGNKTEPFLERGVENWCPCRARFITPAVKRARKMAGEGGQHYLLLTTRHPDDHEAFVVGIMPFAQESFARLQKRQHDRWSENGYLPYVSDRRMKLVTFEHAFPLAKWMHKEGVRAVPGGRGGRGRVPEQLLAQIVAHFAGKRDRTSAFIANVKALERSLRETNRQAWKDYAGRVGGSGKCIPRRRNC
jgi:hypothetical protein